MQPYKPLVESRNRGIFNYMLLSGLIGKLSESVERQSDAMIRSLE